MPRTTPPPPTSNGGSGVSSWNARTGAVVPVAGDYAVADITGAVADTRQIITTNGIQGGGSLNADLTLSLVPASLPSGIYAVLGATNASATSTLAGVANRLVLARHNSFGVLANLIQVEVTTAVAAAQGQIVLYKNNSGIPGTLIWQSGNLDFSTTGVKSLAFSAGTWNDTSYRSGVNFLASPGETIWYGVLHSSTATLRGLAAAGSTVIRYSGLAGTNGVFNQGVATLGSFTVPTTAPAMTYSNGPNALVAGRTA